MEDIFSTLVYKRGQPVRKKTGTWVLSQIARKELSVESGDKLETTVSPRQLAAVFTLDYT